MSGRINWSKAHYARKIREQGSEPIDDFLPNPQQNKNKKRQSAGSQIAKGQPPRKLKKPKQSREDIQAASRLNYISHVKMALASGKTPPPPFKKLNPKLKTDILAAGPQAWAGRQPEFHAAEKRKASAVNLREKDKPSSVKAQLRSDIKKIEAEREALAKQYHLLGAELMKKKKRAYS